VFFIDGDPIGIIGGVINYFFVVRVWHLHSTESLRVWVRSLYFSGLLAISVSSLRTNTGKGIFPRVAVSQSAVVPVTVIS
ncbi:hypothetical protein ACYPTH_28930, partial [Klebsiella pneumoniae]